MSGFLRSPSFPLAVLLAIGPGVAVAQFRTMAPAVTIAFLLCIAAHWRNTRRIPVPRLSLLPALALGLLGWAVVTVLWSIEPARAVETSLALAGLVVLAACASRAIERDAPENRARIGGALLLGLGIGIALLAFDQASQNWFRRAVRGFPEWTPFIGFGLKPAVSVLALLLPLVLAVRWPLRGAAGRAPTPPSLRPRRPLPPSPRSAGEGAGRPDEPSPAQAGEGGRAAAGWGPRALIVVAGVAVSVWLPGESAKIAALLGVLAALAATYAPALTTRAAAALTALLFLTAPLIFSAALTRLPDLSPLPYSASHRVLIWDFVTQRIADRPVLGWGMESSRSIPGGEDSFDQATTDRFGLTSEDERGFFALPQTKRLPLHTHNAALQIWLELGLVGAALAAALAAATILASVAPAAVGAAVAGVVTGQLSFGVWQPWWIASLLLAAVVAGALRPQSSESA